MMPRERLRQEPTTDERMGDAIGAAMDPDGGVRWLVLLLGELARSFLSLAAKRYPEVRGKSECPHCGWRA